jgi:hypothetical protein
MTQDTGTYASLTRSSQSPPCSRSMLNLIQITCLYDMDIPRPDNFNECYLYEGTVPCKNASRDKADKLQS